MNIPENSKYLKGVGDSAWFYIEASEHENEFIISRYTKAGELECKNNFTLQTSGFTLSENFEMTYVSHCTKCTVIQNTKSFVFLKRN